MKQKYKEGQVVYIVKKSSEKTMNGLSFLLISKEDIVSVENKNQQYFYNSVNEEYVFEKSQDAMTKAKEVWNI